MKTPKSSILMKGHKWKTRNPKNTIEILNKYKFVFQKKFGQNFLIDTHVLEKIVNAAEITKDDFVLEIGPGSVPLLNIYVKEPVRLWR